MAFSVGDKLACFFEAQSTLNKNMALRYFIYGGRVYEKLVDNDELYSDTRLIIPTHEFYVLYNGVMPFPETQTYRLSDSFAILPEGVMPLELVVTAYNINPGYNEDIVVKDENLYGYVTFVAKARRFEQSGMDRGSAVKAAAQECIKEDILREYLENNASEVINMLAQEWDWSKAFEINARDAAREATRETEERMRSEMQALVAEKAALVAEKTALVTEVAELKAKLSQLN